MLLPSALLDLAPTDRVLEIGFGGGVTLPTLIERAAFVAGVDRSADSVRWAKTKFAEAVAGDRADFRVGSVKALPYEAATFGKVCTVNTVYFWNSLAAGFAEIHRVLAPGGRAVIGFLPKDRMVRMNMPADIFTLRAPDDAVAAMKGARFDDIRIERPNPDTPWNVIVARA